MAVGEESFSSNSITPVDHVFIVNKGFSHFAAISTLYELMIMAHSIDYFMVILNENGINIQLTAIILYVCIEHPYFTYGIMIFDQVVN